MSIRELKRDWVAVASLVLGAVAATAIAVAMELDRSEIGVVAF